MKGPRAAEKVTQIYKNIIKGEGPQTCTYDLSLKDLKAWLMPSDQIQARGEPFHLCKFCISRSASVMDPGHSGSSVATPLCSPIAAGHRQDGRESREPVVLCELRHFVGHGGDWLHLCLLALPTHVVALFGLSGAEMNKNSSHDPAANRGHV